ncbi:MAG: type II toxin-antitoxin system YoeB family toxin [Bacteroidales bacterium]|nr:type II toxin-antitoxin system YoeB family toxin [Bacteroidales bacterium]
MKYKITISPKAAEHLQRLAKSEPKSFAKAARFLKELAEHPKTGTGHPEPLKGQPANLWSREITSFINIICIHAVTHHFHSFLHRHSNKRECLNPQVILG